MKRNGSFSEKDLCTFHTQVSLSEYLMEDYKAVDTLKSLATFPQNLSKIIAKEKGGLMACWKQWNLDMSWMQTCLACLQGRYYRY